jgi:hypothetical protein
MSSLTSSCLDWPLEACQHEFVDQSLHDISWQLAFAKYVWSIGWCRWIGFGGGSYFVTSGLDSMYKHTYNIHHPIFPHVSLTNLSISPFMHPFFVIMACKFSIGDMHGIIQWCKKASQPTKCPSSFGLLTLYKPLSTPLNCPHQSQFWATTLKLLVMHTIIHFEPSLSSYWSSTSFSIFQG